VKSLVFLLTQDISLLLQSDIIIKKRLEIRAVFPSRRKTEIILLS